LHDSLGDFVYVAEKTKAKKLYVTLGKSRAGQTMVLNGLAVDTPLVISGFECLADGKKIRIVNQEELAKEKAEALAKLKEKKGTVEEKKVAEPKVKTETTAKTNKIAQIDKSRFRVGLTFGLFTINDKNLKAFYPKTSKILPGIELSVHTLHNIDVWASYKSYTTDGKTTQFKNPTQFKVAPLSIGLRYRILKARFAEPFVGAGLNFYSYKETISGETNLEGTKGNATGLHFQGGSYFHIKRFFLGEFFLKYNMVPKTLPDLLPDGTDKLDLSGLEIGIGIGVKF
jgi:outer membrane protein W